MWQPHERDQYASPGGYPTPGSTSHISWADALPGAALAGFLIAIRASESGADFLAGVASPLRGGGDGSGKREQYDAGQVSMSHG
jgi:hypothetical protein